MEPLHEALRLIKRQTELENAMRRPGGIRDFAGGLTGHASHIRTTSLVVTHNSNNALF